MISLQDFLQSLVGTSHVITKEMTEGDPSDIEDCPGARLLKSLAPDHLKDYIMWSSDRGWMTYESIDMCLYADVFLTCSKVGDTIIFTKLL